MYEILIKMDFSAAHFLKGYQGKCEKIHGHNWRVEFVFKKSRLNKIGITEDFVDLKEKCKICLDQFDHKNLNEIPYFKRNNPSAELIARYLFKKVSKKVNNIRLYRINVWESDTSCASFYKE